LAVEIVSSDRGLDCHTCDDRMKEERGCDKDGIIPFWMDGNPVMRCPITLVTSISWEYIKAYGFYEKNLLPNGTGYQNESNKYIQAMMLLGNEFNKIQNKEIKKAKYDNNSRRT